MPLAAYQRCRSHIGWIPVEVPSQSDPDITYTVMLNPFGAIDEAICECEGYGFRGTCAHQSIAKDLWCGWTELGIRARQQTRAQQSMMICPMCGDSTVWAFRRLREDDLIAEG